MSSFRLKVLLFMLPLLLPIGRVEISGEAKSDTRDTWYEPADPLPGPHEAMPSPTGIDRTDHPVVNRWAIPAP